MGLFNFFKKEHKFFTPDERSRIVAAIKEAEKSTSGEIRVFIESHCRYMDALERAGEVFFNLEMDETKEKNAVLVYVAIKDHQLAVFADKHIHEKTGQAYWVKEVATMVASFSRDDIAQGIIDCIKDIGEALQLYFPYNQQTDKNELPDDIVFGH